MLEQKLEQDLKTALLAGDAQRVSTLRGLKSVLLNEKVAKGKRESGLTDEEVLPLLSKQAKQRQESADLYVQGGDQVRADKELSEKAIIEEYLPAQLSEAEIAKVVDEVIAETGAQGPAGMGQVIGQVKQRLGASADGAVIAKIAKEKL
ncbi:MAG TPA: GatB/YqeY domain-containing protein [Verrucomicrobiae bacterium]|nr:GatB/YqeY domain-containing protein [Verrucomicrobiae bacterium]